MTDEEKQISKKIVDALTKILDHMESDRIFMVVNVTIDSVQLVSVKFDKPTIEDLRRKYKYSILRSIDPPTAMEICNQLWHQVQYDKKIAERKKNST